jgi:DME family drug/metabolite transporter
MTVSRRVGFLLVAAAASSWGLWSLFLRPTGLPGTITSPLMFAIMGLVALPFALRAPKARWDRTTVLLLLAYATFDAINVVTFFAAMDRTTVAVAVLTHYLAPVFIALAAPHIDRQEVPGALVAAVVATLGLTLVLEPWRGAAGVWAGGALGAISALAYMGNVFVIGRLTPRVGAARAVSYHSLLAAALLAPLAAAGWHSVEVGDLVRVAAGACTIGAISTVAFVVGLAAIGSARAAVLTFCEPLVAVTIGVLVWHESLGPLAAVGALLIVGAGIHVARERR